MADPGGAAGVRPLQEGATFMVPTATWKPVATFISAV